jgi:hypothetical protein
MSATTSAISITSNILILNPTKPSLDPHFNEYLDGSQIMPI